MKPKGAANQFPVYPSHDKARCFNCGGDLDGYYSSSYYGKGCGEFRQDCCKCRTFTCYDLENRPPRAAS